MVTLSQQMKELADGFRKRFGKTGDLTLADMTKLVTQPPFPNGTVIAKNINSNDTQRVSFDLLAVPPKMNVPITLIITLADVTSCWLYSFDLVFNPGEKEIVLDDQDMIGNGGRDGALTTKVTLPANSIIESNKAELRFISNYNFGGTISEIIATYVCGG